MTTITSDIPYVVQFQPSIPTFSKWGASWDINTGDHYKLGEGLVVQEVKSKAQINYKISEDTKIGFNLLVWNRYIDRGYGIGLVFYKSF